MYVAKCPGQDTRYWRPEDIFEVPCPACDAAVEFFRTDSVRTCDRCGYRFRNPKLDLGCAEWCPAAKDCLAIRMYAPEKLQKEPQGH